ncbi:MAG: TonB-dependent receptor [Cryomorphaceae bacterium]|nr:TonB-dependent receptor [Cryomorphaceae bacterium]
MRKIALLLIGVLLFSSQLYAQKFTISGNIEDYDNGESLIGVSIFAEGTGMGTTSNTYGFYSFSLSPGKYTIVFQYIGYQTIRKEIDLKKDIDLDIKMKEEGKSLDAVEVTTRGADANVKSVEMSVTEISAKEIQKVPQLLGEVDVIRTLTLLPGVSTVGEGANGFNVRGGNVDQNLILLDEAPVFNSSHLFGFFSVFNADAVQSFKLYKGGIPANYGGRLSSVLDVRQREGNSKRFAAQGGLGLLSSRATVEGPIIKDKMSFLLSGRRSYADVFTRNSGNEDLAGNILYFYDFNGKINYRINRKHRLFLSGYFGRDALGIADFVNFNWGNATATLRWNWTISNRLFSNTTLVYSDYDYAIGSGDINDLGESGFAFRLDSRLRNYKFNQQFTWFASSDIQVDFGYEGIYYDFQPGKSTLNTGEISEEIFKSEFAFEPAFYASAEQKINGNFSIQYGLRYSSFYNIGARDVPIYDGIPSEQTRIGTESFGRGEIIEAYNGLNGLEPRFSMNYSLNKTSSIKASYNRTRQYIHLISNTTSPTPLDTWRPAGRFIQPATANQVAAGYFKNLKDNIYEFSVEAFYKHFNNLVDYRDGANIIIDDIETALLTGDGRSYGMEFLVRKQQGKLQGWVAYTLSRAERIVEGDDPFTSISDGEWYPANFDRLHDLSIVVTYTLSKKWDFGANFAYQTGRPVTFPVGRAEVDNGLFAPVNTLRNSSRIPDFHRLDLSANYTPKGGKENKKRWESSWSFGIYNVYARRNPFSVFFRNNPDNPAQNQAVRLAIFGTIIPSVTYNFTF